MELREFYQEVSGDYDGAMRLLLSEKRIFKYLCKFLDTDDFSNMNAAIAEGKWEDAFRFSHNLKGVCLNLNLGALAESSSALCECFRHGAPTEDYSELQKTVSENYRLVTEKIGILKESMEL